VSYRADRIREYGFTHKEATTLERLSLDPDDLHRVAPIGELGADIPLVLALKRAAPEFGRVLTSFREHTRRVEIAETRQAREVVARARAQAARLRREVAIEAETPGLSDDHDRRAAPVQRFRAGLLVLVADFDCDEYRAHGRRWCNLDEPTLMRDRRDDAIALVADKCGADETDAAEMVDAVRAAHERWRAEMIHLGEWYDRDQIRALMMRRARSAPDLSQLELPGVQ
jgi:hypothetical protein